VRLAGAAKSRRAAALVLGPEWRGLSDEELDLCNVISAIPTDAQQTSLNLAQAAVVYLYELYRAAGEKMVFPAAPPLPFDEREKLLELGIGGSAVGTGINTHPQYQKKVIQYLREITGYKFKGSKNLIASMQSMGDFISLSAKLKLLSVELIRIANDLRLLSSGPGTGISEIRLPAVQPGSSIMPGKVNPVMAEVLNMVCFQVIGNDMTITMAGQAGQLELNVMMPVINYNLLSSIHLLTNVIKLFTERCVSGIEADEERCSEFAESSAGLATILNPFIGYEAAAKLAKEALLTKRSIIDLVIEKGILTNEEAKSILDPYEMTGPKTN